VIVFATLGPAGTNHEFITKRFIAFHQIESARIELVDDFSQAIEGLRAAHFDFVIQCAVHPDTPITLGSNFRDVFAVDAFISPSKDLAILTRNEVASPKSIGLLLPATEKYVNLNRWAEKHTAPSIPIIFENLLNEQYDSALVYLEYAEKYPDRVRVDEIIGSPDDVWIVYGTTRTSGGGLLDWPDSPVSQIIKQKSRTVNTATEGLGPFRSRLNDIDQQITNLLAQRFRVCAEVANYKKENNIPMMQPDRVEAVKKRCADLGAEKGLRPEFVKKVYSCIIQEACDLEDKIIASVDATDIP
jgi:chorismate mutase-like protein